MKEASAKMQKRQNDIKHDKPFVVKLGNKRFRCKYLKSWVSDKISAVLIDADLVNVEEKVFEAMEKNGEIPAKTISLMILNSYWKIKFLHPFFWRYIHRNFTYSEMVEAIGTLFDMMDMSNFMMSILLASELNTMRKRTTQKEVKQLLQELQSAKKPLS